MVFKCKIEAKQVLGEAPRNFHLSPLMSFHPFLNALKWITYYVHNSSNSTAHMTYIYQNNKQLVLDK